jgi:hypothetical protein
MVAAAGSPSDGNVVVVSDAAELAAAFSTFAASPDPLTITLAANISLAGELLALQHNGGP